MRLSRIIMAIAVGLTVTATPTAAGAALSQPQPPPGQPAPQLPYQPQPPRLTVSPSTITLGETVTVSGNRFTLRERVRITVTTDPRAAGVAGVRRSDGSTVAIAPVAYQREDATQLEVANGSRGPWDGTPDGSPRTLWVTADEDGEVSFTYRPRRAGTITFSARGEDSERTATAVLTVLQERDRPPLPVTGSNVSTPMKVGGGLAGAGALLVLTTFAWRRRSRFGADA